MTSNASSGATALAGGVAAVALVLAVLAWMREPIAAPSQEGGDANKRLEAIERRLDGLERNAPSPTVGAAPAGTEADLRTRTVVESDVSSDVLARLEARIARLESAAPKRAPQGLSKPDGIPAALAILLATRGVVVTAGDVEALADNAPVLAELVRDPRAPGWHRIEAFRGVLMFGGAALALETAPDLATILESEPDAAVRESVAHMISGNPGPRLAATLIRSYSLEQSVAVRRVLVERLLENREQLGVVETLRAAARSDADATIRSRITAELDR